MAGFYGNVGSTTKTPFTYDLVYNNRVSMDAACPEDGVFLGRYVLIEYDASTVRGYYKNNKFYRDAAYTELIPGEEHVVYQNLLEAAGFYIYSATSKTWIKDTTGANSSYSLNYSKDVKAYGRGYDSTVWIKHYDVQTNTYHYLLLAELNATTPTFHLINDAPQEIPVAPYFDENSSNLDYYLHHEVNFTNRIKATDSDHPYSDVTVTRPKVEWSYDGRMENRHESTEVVDAAIYFNKDGFSKTTRSYKTDAKAADGFGYTSSSSGRQYSAPVLGAGSGSTADDTKDWYLYLPSLGNAICEMWDDIYGEDRILTIPTEHNQNDVNYDDTTIFGFCNKVRDMMGYTLKPKGSAPAIKNEVDNNLYYENEKYYYYASNLDGSLYTLKEIPASEATIYGLITTMHRLVGTGEELTEATTIISCLNKMKELLARFNDPFDGSRLVATDAQGRITSTSTTFPVADSVQVLTGAGNWKYVSELGLNGYQSTSELLVESDSINNAFNKLSVAIDNEINRATSAESVNNSAITKEATRAQGVEEQLSQALSTEIIRAGNAESALSDGIASETSRAGAAEAQLLQAITDESTRATAEEQALTKAINDEAIRASAAEAQNAQDISGEIARAKAAEVANTNAIATEATTARAAEKANADNIAAEKSRAEAKEQEISNAIAAEVSRATGAENANASAISTEKSRAEGVEASLENRIKTLEEAKYGEALGTINETIKDLPTKVATLEEAAKQFTTLTAADSAHDSAISGLGSRVDTLEKAGYITSDIVTNAANAIWADLVKNFNLTLNQPVCEVAFNEVHGIITYPNDLSLNELTLYWEYKNVDAEEFAVSESAPAHSQSSFSFAEDGTYRIRVVREHNGFTAEWISSEHTYTTPITEE